MKDGTKEVNAIEYWRFCDQLSVVQAALLIVGEDPSSWQETIGKTYSSMDRPTGYDATITALINSIRSKQLNANIIHYEDEDGRYLGPNWDLTTIEVHELRTWLQWRGVKGGFFFPEPETGPNYLSKSHPNYSRKLAAAVQAWKAISKNPDLSFPLSN
jgi:hypothetical protein